jgi:hypothetical protein
MKSLGNSVLFIFCFSVFTAASAGKPTKGEDGPYIGNGFPSGPHFNLNIHGKNENFTCPAAKYEWTLLDDPVPDDGLIAGDVVIGEACPAGYSCSQGDQVFGNVINIPQDGQGVQILVESGRKGPKSKETTTNLEVTDWCADIGGDNDAAEFRLPADPDGYAVYARVTGKPTEDPWFEIYDRSFDLVEVECDSEDTSDNCALHGTYDLLLLGVVHEDGTFTPGTDGTLERVDTTDGRGGKGVKNATDITGLFEFTGSVCYIYDTDPACEDPDFLCTATTFCCATDVFTGEYVVGFDGVSCQDKFSSGYFSYLDEDNVEQFDCNVQDTEFIDWVEQDLYCRDYVESWIFNIADFVNVLFDVNNHGAYNVQFRFYPLPLQEGKAK